MKLQLLISHWREDETIVKPLLDSIEMQKDIPFREFGVIIVNDGEEGLLSEKFLSQYSFKINYLVMPKGNVSKARNYALDHATAKYVMFCDCDDKFCLDIAFWIIFREMKKPFDILNSTFLEEKDGFGTKHEYDNTFIHGKVWNRQFLVDHNLRFDEELYVHEDGYFVALAQCEAGIVRRYDIAFYLWVTRENTTCRTAGFIQRTWVEYIKAKDKLITELLKRGYEEYAAGVLAIFLIEAKERNLDKQNMYASAKLYDKYRDLFNTLTNNDKVDICRTLSKTYKHKVTLSTAYFERLLNM